MALSRRQLTLAVIGLSLHIPAFIAFLVANRGGDADPTAIALFAVFGVTCVIALPCIAAFWFDVSRNEGLDRDQRKRWHFYLAVLPQSGIVYWWSFVRPRPGDRSPSITSQGSSS